MIKEIQNIFKLFFSLIIGAAAVSYTHLDVYKRQELFIMPNQKILYVTTEMFPYQEESNMAMMVNKMALKMHQEGNDVRVFMPRFGLISERKFQLHEVIRLSGMNIIINDLDQPLIIKVASLPGERLQVYFIAVSYTHLDVYKRQVLGFIKQEILQQKKLKRIEFIF